MSAFSNVSPTESGRQWNATWFCKRGGRGSYRKLDIVLVMWEYKSRNCCFCLFLFFFLCKGTSIIRSNWHSVTDSLTNNIKNVTEFKREGRKTYRELMKDSKEIFNATVWLFSVWKWWKMNTKQKQKKIKKLMRTNVRWFCSVLFFKHNLISIWIMARQKGERRRKI